MTMFAEDDIRACQCVAWNSNDDVVTAQLMFFDNKEESKNFAQAKCDSKMPFIWMSELGRYENNTGKIVMDWMLWWWRGDHIEAGDLPRPGEGVPYALSWDYRVKYVPLVSRAHDVVDTI